jgi:acyl dehydratase
MIGLWFEELEIGQGLGVGTHAFTAKAIRRFSSSFVPVGFHMDAAQAEAGLFGKTVAAGLHTCCGWMICFVELNMRERERLAAAGKLLPEIGLSPGLQNIRWPNPVFAGDVIHYRSTITEKRLLKSKPGWGMTIILCEGHKADGTMVVRFESKVLVQRRAR